MTKRLSGAILALWLAGCGGSFPVTEAQRDHAVERHDAASLPASVARILDWHRGAGTGLELRPGTEPARIREALTAAGLHATDELVALYAIADGARDEADVFVWYHDFLPLDRAIAARDRLRRIPLLGWDADYLPLFTFQGEWFAVDCGQPDRAASPVVHLFIEDAPRVAFTNLSTMLQTMAETMASGAMRWDAEHRAIVDDVQAIAAIHARLNPGSAFPYHVPE